MRMHLISDNSDTLTGMRMVGVSGVIVHTREELKAALDNVLEDSSIGIVLIMENLAGKFPDIIDEIKLLRPLPLLVEIPDRHGSGRKSDFITDYIREAIGVKL